MKYPDVYLLHAAGGICWKCNNWLHPRSTNSQRKSVQFSTLLLHLHSHSPTASTDVHLLILATQNTHINVTKGNENRIRALFFSYQKRISDFTGGRLADFNWNFFILTFFNIIMAKGWVVRDRRADARWIFCLIYFPSRSMTTWASCKVYGSGFFLIVFADAVPRNKILEWITTLLPAP